MSGKVAYFLGHMPPTQSFIILIDTNYYNFKKIALRTCFTLFSYFYWVKSALFKEVLKRFIQLTLEIRREKLIIGTIRTPMLNHFYVNVLHYIAGQKRKRRSILNLQKNQIWDNMEVIIYYLQINYDWQIASNTDGYRLH